MKLEEIQNAVNSGKNVYWKNANYRVIRDRVGQWLIHSQFNNDCIGLTERDGATLSDDEDAFYIKEED